MSTNYDKYTYRRQQTAWQVVSRMWVQSLHDNVDACVIAWCEFLYYTFVSAENLIRDVGKTDVW